MNNATNERSVLHEIARILKGLTEADIEDIKSGRMRFALVPVEDKGSAAKVSDYDGSELIGRLRLMESREAAERLLDEAALKVPDLKQVMKQLGVMPVGSTRSKLIDQIVRTTVGVRLQSEAVRGVRRT